MDSDLDKITSVYRLRSRDGQQPFSKEIGSEFSMPKFPIEKHELKTHIMDIKLHSDYEFNDCDFSANFLVDNATTNDPLNQLHLTDRKMLESTMESSTHFQSKKFGIPTYQRITIGAEEEASMTLEEIKGNAEALLTAIKMRRGYMNIAKQHFNKTTDRYISMIDSGIDTNDHHEINNQLSMQMNDSLNDHPYHAPGTQGDPYKVDKFPDKIDVDFAFKNGVMFVSNKAGDLTMQCGIDYSEFVRDYHALSTFVSDGPLKSFCFKRLNFLHYRFKMHTLLNEWQETAEQKSVSHRDFYNIRKVDTHIHASSSMNQKHLLRFIKKCIKQYPNEKVIVDKNSGNILTLVEVFKSLGLTPYDLTIDKLDVHCDRDTFHRFDKFNAKYNPVGQSELREVFLKSDNYNDGRFFARVLKEVMEDLEESKYQNAELRLSVYGRKHNEWDQLAKWAVTNKLYSDNVKWMIQFPRIYDIFRTKNLIKNFQEILHNIFMPLFEVTRDPSSHPELHSFLLQVSGFDSVDDESKHESCVIDNNTALPQDWDCIQNPPYPYYLYYMYANMTVLNELRNHVGLNTFTFRPHCGEAGPVQHLVAGFLLAHNINHGLLLRKAPVLQYLYYLCQIGIAMSPLSNNSLFLDYQRNPLHDFLCRGLNVSLSTDDPLQFHFTKEPLMEEYSIAAQVWKLTSTDMCELARNSVMMSGFSDTVKSFWLGKQFKEEGVQGNDVIRTNVPNIRIAFRFEALTTELNLLLRKILTVRGNQSDNYSQ